MNHADLITAGYAVKYDANEHEPVPQYASVCPLGEAFAHADHKDVTEALTRLLRTVDGYDDVLFVHDWRNARRAARKEIE